MLLMFQIEVINLIFIGTYNDPTLVAAVGLGNMTVNVACFAFIIGLNSALQTLISQASGAGQIELCGVYKLRGQFIITVVFIPILCVLVNSERILVALG